MFNLVKNALLRNQRTFSTRSIELNFSQEVQYALRQKKPIVALESTIITHGMPYPENLQTAQQVEQIVRDQGCIPATIAILGGNIQIGLDQKQLENLAALKRTEVVKVTSRDLGYILANKMNGGTTVAATLVLAQQAGIKVFVTGGIGGVHRDVNDSMDVSADLVQLSNSSVICVCAGVKTVLDIPKTLEYLETFSVPVFSYQTEEFPAFFVRKSGSKTLQVKSSEEIAKIYNFNQSLGLKSGMLIGVPIPEKSQYLKVQSAIDQALQECKDQNITGSKITPFLLARVKQLSGGQSLEASKYSYRYQLDKKQRLNRIANIN